MINSIIVIINSLVCEGVCIIFIGHMKSGWLEERAWSWN